MPSATRSSNHGPSFLRWAGSKRKSLGVLSSAFSDPSRQYVEPFAGSAALFFSLQPDSGLLGDLNGHLVNAMRHVRDRPRELHKQLVALKRSPKVYYEVRDTFNTMRPNGLEAAVFFVYLNRNCFNGLWRTNSKGLFNVPFGGHEMGGNPPLSLLQDCSVALKRVRLRHQDFRKTIAEAGRHSFIYADPPYFSSIDRTFIEYGKKSFGPQDLDDLIFALREAVRRGATVALTYNESMPIKGIPKSWHRTRFEVTRNVGGFSGSRKKQVEVLYSNSPILVEAT
ncbi:Dam family site-specific DNA-(adenine-N6)-methyltransferase [Bradyrhizobium sp. 170]|uniref:DNA adenine methylase n=1 Tax=Bradyrhizobium sp. 170 TaxID=2782641 RepID=UPI001FFEE7EC|nr:Dam family site-specific DNA-(adenine-N6)-methyltransferase [Bradyrhizobium sp. 170]UPK03015.1 Dam family site-specific DNA-(adenine-N6)-methyltransferase [Bradyrhizobium sp. 170]